MSYTVYQTNKKTGTVYAYRAESYRDPETGKTKSRRTYLGRVDPETKLIVGKEEAGKRNRTKLGKAVEPEDFSVASPEVSKVIDQQREQIASLQKQLVDLNHRHQSLLQSLSAIRDSIDSLITG